MLTFTFINEYKNKAKLAHNWIAQIALCIQYEYKSPQPSLFKKIKCLVWLPL